MEWYALSADPALDGTCTTNPTPPWRNPWSCLTPQLHLQLLPHQLFHRCSRQLKYRTRRSFAIRNSSLILTISLMEVFMTILGLINSAGSTKRIRKLNSSFLVTRKVVLIPISTSDSRS